LGLLELMQGKSTPSCQQVLKPSLWHFKGWS
jgi:hypothetical protein